MMRHFGWTAGQTALGVVGILVAGVVGIAAYVGPHLDQFLIGLPVVGNLYERYVRAVTYYRIDQTCMYRAAVEAAVDEAIGELTKAQPIRPASEFARRPPLSPDLAGHHDGR